MLHARLPYDKNIFFNSRNTCSFSEHRDCSELRVVSKNKTVRCAKHKDFYKIKS